jgi:hypothetical protein
MLAAMPTVSRLVGTYVDTDGVRGVVDVGGGRIPADYSGYLPAVGEPVWVLFINGTATILGPTQLKPDRGTVTGAPSGNLVPVSTIAGAFSVPYASGLSLSNGQIVKLGAANGNELFAYAVMSTSPTPATPPSPPGGGSSEGFSVFTAIDSGSYQGRWWTGEVYASNTNTGAFFYGSKIADTIPDNAAILSIELNCSIRMLQYQAPIIGYHGSPTKPGGNVSIGGAAAVNITGGYVALPTSIGDYLKANAGGIGIATGGYSILNALAADAQSGALRIRWRA